MSMTIKQAFEKLTMVCGAALKNPFFVQRNLHDAFADLAANIEEGGGGSSSAEDVSYDNSDSGLSAENVQAAIDEIVSEMPTPTSQDYSTTERIVGKWIDGTTDVYERTFYATNLQISDNQYFVIDSTFTNSSIDLLVECSGGAKTSNGSGFVSISGLSIDIWDFGLHINSNGLLLYGRATSIVGGSACIRLRYTKPTI